MEGYNRKKALRDSVIVIVFSLTLLTVFSLLTIIRRQDRKELAPPRPVYVTTVTPERRDIRRTLKFSSVLDAESSITVLPRISGAITEISVEEGREVTAGEVLARIDPEPYRLEMKSAESAWLLAESSYTRIESLHAGSGASRQQLDEAAAERDAARSSYELAKMQYEYSEVRSPVDGVILSRFADEGSLAMPGQPLFTVGSDGSYRVVVRIPEKYWPEFRNYEDIRMSVGPPEAEEDQLRTAEILRLSPSISPIDRTFQVTGSVERDGISWPLGSRVSAVFVLQEEKDTWSLPLRTQTGESSVWWVNTDDSTAHRMELPPGLSDGIRRQIPAGLADRVFVLEGQHRLRENMAVRPGLSDSVLN